MSLSEQHCEACRADAPLANEQEIRDWMLELPDWTIQEQQGVAQLQREYAFVDFKQALRFTNQVGACAEKVGHHPAIVTEWGKVTVVWWTHKIKGLHRNDFIMASRCDDLAGR